MDIDTHKGFGSRRSFLKLSGLLGIGTVAAALLPSECGETLRFNRTNYKLTKTRLAMGTFVAMTAIHPSQDQAEEAFDRAFEEITRLTSLLSRHDPASAVSELNRSSRVREAPVEVRDVVARALTYYRETAGTFDITVQPIVDLYRTAFDAGRRPRAEEIEALLASVDARNVRIDGTTIEFVAEGMGITLDGIAKGYIIDRASEILSAYGIENHLINGGGDIRVSGTAMGDKNWTIAIQDPAKKRHYPDIIAMGAGAIATSGNYEVYYDQEKLFHHIVDGRSGHSPHIFAATTVMAPTVMAADAFSTALFVQPPESALAFAEGRNGCESLLVMGNGALYKTSGWPA